jgi:diguanylate cyclase (GGDEF)-like protein
VAILVIDLDGFKDINDSLGHDAGDDLLTIAGMRLQGHARPDDTVARLGGDEFGVLLEDVAGAEAVRSAEALLEGLATPIVLRDRDLTPTASIGIAIAAGEDAETLPRNADTAMYAANGRARAAMRSSSRPCLPRSWNASTSPPTSVGRSRKVSCTCATSHR